MGTLIKTEPQKVNTETLSVFGTSTGSFVCKVVSSEFIFYCILQRSKIFVEHVLDVLHQTETKTEKHIDNKKQIKRRLTAPSPPLICLLEVTQHSTEC